MKQKIVDLIMARIHARRLHAEMLADEIVKLIMADPATSHCTCPDKDKHGETTIWCCNHCGLPTEEFWKKKPIEDEYDGTYIKDIFTPSYP